MKIRKQLFWKRLFTFCFALIVLKAGLAEVLHRPAVQAQTAPVDFARDIEPIFQQSCNACHGAKKASGQLRLDVKALALKGGLSGALLVPGNSRASLLLKRILGEGGEARMPLGGEALKPEQIELIRRWIDEGAQWPAASDLKPQTAELPKHWAYVKPVQAPLPAVKSKVWARNAIDRFVLARLEQEGLKPAPEADKLTLLRRVSFDLTGLPPTLQEADDFLADAAPNAYEKAVDRLLASPHYGERWARPWLDLARYADSHGYEKDRPRVMWKYRDWVVNALNADKPFDQFTLEQLAGDMLADATNEQLIATGFHRNTMLNQEGGVDDEEARWETLVDRVNTTATVWLGSTIGCAQCHNHKYDPFSQKDYYRLFAFFDAHEYSLLEMPGSEGWVIEPELELPTPEQAAQRLKLEAEIKTLEAKLKAETPELAHAQTQWESELRAAPQAWTVLAPLRFDTTGGSKLEKQSDHSLWASGTAAASETYIVTLQPPALAGAITALRLEVMPDPRLPQGGPGRDIYGNFVLSEVEVEAADAPPVRFSAAQVNDASGKLTLDSPYTWVIDATRDETRRVRQAVFVLKQPLVIKAATPLTIKLKQNGLVVNQGLGRIRLSVTTTNEPLRIVSLPLKFQPALETLATQRTASQRKELAEQFRQATPLLKPERERLKQLRKAVEDLGIVKAQIMREKKSFERPSTELRVRGSYTNKGERVYAATPAALHAWPEDAPYNRLGLARWLMSAENPLTARVAVNRYWEQLFGRGLVETAEDFGLQSSPPSHPELLDWLAVEFRSQQWSVKQLLRLMVMSATYRQSSQVSAARQERDPYNRLLARGPRFRLEAETIRDAALQASGLLNRAIGGPSVFPLQPEGIWANPYDGNNIKWMTSKGADLYRRSLYTFLRRTAPYPMMTTLDAPSREFCTVRRIRTNTPLQALSLLNDEAAFVMARALAQRMLTDVSGSVTERLRYGFRRCVARPPTATELARLEKLFNEQLALYQKDPVAAQQVAPDSPGDLSLSAAYTMVANVLLNLDETLTKE
jgi:mono/diheme cytochrome c family protein